ncbi:TonB-linked outer membrane protein, SusC/RagA family [Flavobacterium fluvii]|uniref:TonB-linked outer membrane protein, SusC/RagA family n=1 Tax=Flavobacterium fluvii TaxID=468056 RepID=A0A1M5PK90_9FLAO|nr:TonB-dependent receptor [Flavobacterium fluvii]SHH02127.1 TonB-linked outer membrane protein, SusC/RagA family [Flavobacterium fluvii]
MKKSILKYFIFFSVLFSCLSATAQKKITGIVKDAVGLTIPGANVKIKDKKAETQTDFDGNFTISAESGDVLIFSFVGMTTTEITIDSRSNYTVVMQELASQLNEVVVVGYGTKKKTDVTGAVSTANLKAFEDSPNPNLAQSLQGSVAGLNVGQTNSAGSTPNISIRGRNSLAGNNNVLIVVDGIVYTGSINDLNPDDVASVDVLKDASSTAIYGAQGANGILMITTKKGNKNKAPQISFSNSYTTQIPTINVEPLDRQDYLDKVRDLYWNKSYLAPDYTVPDPSFNLADYVDDSLVNQGQISGADYNWWDAATKTGSIQDFNLSVSGGGDNMSYLLSASHTDQEGYIINDVSKRTTIRANIDVNLKDWWTVGMQSFATFSDYSGEEPTLSGIIRQAPLVEPFDADGNLIPFPTGTIYSNPFMTYYVDNLDKSNNLFGNFYSDIKFPFIKGLSYRVNFGNNYRWANEYGSSIYGAGLTGSAYKNHSTRYDYTFDNIFTYKRTFAENHELEATFLYGASEREAEDTSATGEGFTDLSLSYNALEQATIQKITSGGWHEALSYQMGRVNYKYKDKYLFTGTIRRDGFSGFAENEKWGVFPSAALGWVITKEDFFKSKVVDLLKLRAGYGSNGNLTSRYFSLSRIGRSSGYVYGDGGSTEFMQQLNTLANANLQWESTGGINLGLDFKLFKGILSGSVEYYNTETKNQLFSRSVPSITGVTSVNVNLGNIQNTGYEFSLTSNNIKNDNFSWSTTFNYSHNDNKILALTGLDEDGNGVEDDIVADNLFIGKSIGTIYAYEAGPIYQIGDVIPTGYYPGTRKVIDQNNDGLIDSNDRVFQGKSEPEFRAGLLNTFTYKDFTLNVFLNTVQGGKDGYLSANEPTYGGRQSEIDNLFNILNNTDFWTPLNPDGINSRYVTAPKVIPSVFYERDFVRLQDVSLSYNFPKSLLDSAGLNSLRLFVSGKNLATWTDWKGWDPETGQGLRDDGRPVLKGYSFGLNVTF